jgi:hypothetical protein
MQVSVSEFTANGGEYLDLAETQDIFIVSEKRVAKIVLDTRFFALKHFSALHVKNPFCRRCG